jgi:uncharacterized iron-regulated membrane protein
MLRKLILIYALCLAPLMVADDSLLQWMDRTAERQLAAREAALAKIHIDNGYL